MTPIRILLARISVELSDTVRSALEEQADMEVIGIVSNPVETLVSAGMGQADVVVVGVPAEPVPALVGHLLTEYPNLRVIALAPGAGEMFLYTLRPHMVALGPVSAERLVQTIRTATGGYTP